jgi:exonuclease III
LPWKWTDSLAGPKHWKRDRFDTWNVRSLHRADLLKIGARELGKYKLDLVGVQEVRWEKGSWKGQRIIRSSMERGMKIISYGQVFSYIRESYQKLGG